MDASFNSLAAARYRSTGRTPARRTVITAHAANARATATLALAAYGLVTVVERLGAPWAWLVQTLVLALLALGFVVMARRSHDHRAGWLLSGSVALGLAIAAFSNAIGAGATPALPLAVLLVCVATLLFVVYCARRRPQD